MLRGHIVKLKTSEMAIELPPEEQVKGEDLIGELLKSLYGTREAAHNWEEKWQRVIIDWFCHRYMVTSNRCCRERELCGFVQGDDFIITGDSMQSAWIESRLNEGLILKRRAILGPDDGDDKTVTILNRLVTSVCLGRVFCLTTVFFTCVFCSLKRKDLEALASLFCDFIQNYHFLDSRWKQEAYLGRHGCVYAP